MNKSILITGVAGTGKSAVCDELNKLGYKALGIEDIDGLFTIVHKKTGKPMSKEVADKRYQSYLKDVYSYSNDAQIILTVDLEHRLHIQKMEV